MPRPGPGRKDFGGPRTGSLQLDVKATAELEADLARARLGAAARGQPT